MTPLIVEFLGTLLLLTAVAFGHNPLLVIAAVAIAITFGGKISGGHFNPAVTAYTVFSGKMSQSRGLWYVGAQLAAGLLIACISFI